MRQYKQPWIANKAYDLLWILSPPFLSVLIVWLMPAVYKNSSELSLISWVVLILLIDVAHVYSTLFRTYFNPQRFRQQRDLFLFAPLSCYIVGVLLYALDDLLFWRTLAYLAVFHFIRQQYGFMKLYSRGEEQQPVFKQLDIIVVYAATLYPIVFWHFSSDRKFNWFVEGDFYHFSFPSMLSVFQVIYLALLSAYVVKELWLFVQRGFINIPRNLIIAGTAVSWYLGIVYFNADMAFTLLNVVSHGIPYMALIWATSREESNHGTRRGFYKAIFSRYGVLLFLGVLFLFAWFEEGLWDGFVWKEHSEIFGFFSSLPQLRNSMLLALLIPLLSLPQATHYVLDGFIWKRKK